MNSGNCSCNTGWAGISCDSMCSENGIIDNGECECFYDEGWKGPLCDIPGCPGLFKLDCSGRGKVLVRMFGAWSCCHLCVSISKTKAGITSVSHTVSLRLLDYEPHHEKTCLRGLRSGKTQTSLLSY